MTFTQITVDPDLMADVPTIRGLRTPVATVVSMVADGMTVGEICRDLPDLAPEDVAEAPEGGLRVHGQHSAPSGASSIGKQPACAPVPHESVPPRVRQSSSRRRTASQIAGVRWELSASRSVVRVLGLSTPLGPRRR
jgi:uncharacterized protein (DUF433 family)